MGAQDDERSVKKRAKTVVDRVVKKRPLLVFSLLDNCPASHDIKLNVVSKIL